MFRSISTEAGPEPCTDASLLRTFREEIRRRWGVPTPALAAPVPGRRKVLATGCTVVDELLPGGGIPRGRLVEVSGGASSGKTSLVLALAARTQRDGKAVAWVDPWGAFYAPSASRAGVQLDPLILVQPPRVTEVFRAGEHLLRSGALALVVLDAVGLPGRGVTSPLYRLDRLCRRQDVAVVLITDHPERVQSLGSPIALRLRIERRGFCFEPEPRPPFDITGYRIEVEVGKTKLGPAGGPRLVEVRNPAGVAHP